MKKFALLALVLAFGGLVLAGCPSGANNAPTSTGNNTGNATPATNK